MNKNQSFCNTPPLSKNNSIKSNTYSENGRSMVEILGVLAVIGVLSVGGMAAYKNAMNKHEANSVVADLSKRATVLSGQIQFGQSPSLSGFSIYAGDYELAQMTNGEQFFVSPDKKTFSMTVQDVPPEVCEKIINLNWKMASLQPADCSEPNLLFTFNADFSAIDPNQALPALCQVDSDCEGCASCQNRQCVAECGKGLVCDSAKQVCGECVTNNDCEAGEFCARDGLGKATITNENTCQTAALSTTTYPFGLIRGEIQNVSFADAQNYCDALGRRLPTMAEWINVYGPVTTQVTGQKLTAEGDRYMQEAYTVYTYKGENRKVGSIVFCVQDTAEGSCPDGTVLADDDSGHCVDCNSDADCGGDTPYCNKPWHVCVSCLTDDHCGQDSYCTTNTQDTMCNHYSAGCVTRNPSNKGHSRDGKQWYWVKSGYATWYEANALCKAYGARMPTLAEFGYTQQPDGTWVCDKTTKACGISPNCLVTDRFAGQTQCQTTTVSGQKVLTNQLKANGGTSTPAYACCVVN